MNAKEREESLRSHAVGRLEGWRRGHKRRYLGALSVACILTGVTDLAVQLSTPPSFDDHRQYLASLNERAVNTERFFPYEVGKVVGEEKERLGLEVPVNVQICTQYDECRKAGTSYAQAYRSGPFVTYSIYLQPGHLSRGIVRHELWHVKNDLPNMIGRDVKEQNRYYWQTAEPGAAAYGAGKPFKADALGR